MIELWYGFLALTLIVYVVLDGRNFGAGILHLFVARTPMERRQVVSAIGPLWPWHEVWLVSFGGVLFVAFPRLYAVSFSGYYLALFLILWSALLRGISLEVGGHLNDRMWQSFWDTVFALSSLILGILFGVALGDLARGVPLDAEGTFSMAFFTNFNVRGNVGLLDWYTISVGLISLIILTAHGATYLTLRTEGPVHDRCELISRRLWSVIPFLFLVVTAQTWYVRPALASQLIANPIAWMGIFAFLIGAFAIFTGLRGRLESRAFLGSGLLIIGLLAAGAVTVFPVTLYSTLAPENSLTAYNTAASLDSLELALIWWPIAMIMTWVYFWFVSRHYSGKIKVTDDTQGFYHVDDDKSR